MGIVCFGNAYSGGTLKSINLEELNKHTNTLLIFLTFFFVVSKHTIKSKSKFYYIRLSSAGNIAYNLRRVSGTRSTPLLYVLFREHTLIRFTVIITHTVYLILS